MLGESELAAPHCGMGNFQDGVCPRGWASTTRRTTACSGRGRPASPAGNVAGNRRQVPHLPLSPVPAVLAVAIRFPIPAILFAPRGLSLAAAFGRPGPRVPAGAFTASADVLSALVKWFTT